MTDYPMEVLAPAGGMESLTAAVRCGADAVYLGGSALNARRNAANFDDGQLREAVAYCRVRGVKVYLALNTLVFDSEMPQVEQAVELACSIGIDGCIVQDLGVADYIRKTAPQMPLHASTQMSVHSLDGARMLEELGFSRVVLARELSASEIRGIAENTRLQIECFVHGALCYCVSGQCAMSALLGSRSGNRGLCAQPCRLPFGSGENSYALSLKDLSLIDRIGELQEAGVTSLKIEGRMKRPEYVAAAVTACRQSLEGQEADFHTLKAVFSRSGFTSGYFDGRIGLSMKGVRRKEDVTATMPVLKELSALYRAERPAVRVSFHLSLQEGESSVLTAQDQDGHVVRAEGAVPQAARTASTDAEKAAAALGKLGGTPYLMERLDCKIGPGLMLPVSALNALRREAIEKLDGERLKGWEIPYERKAFALPVHKSISGESARIWARAGRAVQLTPGLLDACDRIVVPAAQFPGLPESLARGRADKLMIEIPSILFEGAEELDRILGNAREMGISHAVAGSLDSIGIGKRHGFILHGSHSLNITNSGALRRCQEFGLMDAVVSFELKLSQAAALKKAMPVGIFAYGRLPLMTSRVCPLGGEKGCGRCREGFGELTDRKDSRFLVECQWGAAVIWNTVPLYMADRLPELAGMDILLLNFTDESPERCVRLAEEYRTGGTLDGDKTRGLYYRGVL